MGLILNIDTATEYASICLANNGVSIAFEENNDQKNHGSFIQPAIEKLFTKSKTDLQQIDAIAITNGPGSYTGLRVGLSSAKGLCYALNKPLITVNTLEVIAYASLQNIENIASSTLLCPMIDARRMEVFTGLYNINLTLAKPPVSMVLNEQSFTNELANHTIIFSGSGQQKFQNIMHHANAMFSAVQHSALQLAHLSNKYFEAETFANLAYSEPFYLKEVFLPEKS